MLVLSRKCAQSIRIGDGITLTVLATEGGRVRLGVTAPPEVKVLRQELLDADARRRRASRRILIVDDCPEDREAVRRFIATRARERYLFAETDSGEEGLALCRAEPPDCVLLDYKLPDLDGIEFLDRLRREQDRLLIPVIMVTGKAIEGLADRVVRRGARRLLVKDDLSPELLQRAVREALRGQPAN